MFGMSMTEILMIVVILLVVVGPDKIPDVARAVGKGMREVRKASNLLKDAMLIEDAPKMAANLTSTMQSNSFDDVESDLPYSSSDFRQDPSPEKNVEWVALGRKEMDAESYVEVELAATTVDAAQTHREVYLHIPYEETI